jgi:hypothetical protein
MALSNRAKPTDTTLDILLAALPPAPHDTDERRQCRAAAAAVLLRSLDAEEPIEEVLATQAVLAYHATMECLRRAVRDDLPPAISSRLTARAARLSLMFIRTLNTLDRRQARTRES